MTRRPRLLSPRTGRPVGPPRPTPVELVPDDEDLLLGRIRDISVNARGAWFGLLALLAFVSVTLMTHEDSDFWAVGAATQLPLINIDVPPTAFFIAAPLLVAVLYIYLHLYLLTLWDVLKTAPHTIRDKPLPERIHPTLLALAALWYRNRVQGDGASPPRRLGFAMAAASILLAWGGGIVILILLWRAGLRLHHEGLGLWLALCLGTAAIVGTATFRVMCLSMEDAPEDTIHAPWTWSNHWRMGSFAAVLAIASLAMTEGLERFVRSEALRTGEAPNRNPEDWERGNRPAYERHATMTRNTLLPADMVEADLTTRPDDWRPWPLWRDDFRDQYHRDRGWALDRERTPDEDAAFQDKLWERYRLYLESLDAPIMEGADLREADLTRAFLPNADLESARLAGANLRDAEMQGVNLIRAEMQGANLFGAEMQGANLRGAEMQGADLRGAEMQGANLIRGEMQGANLSGAQMQGASLIGAEMQGADLFGAEMQGAYLGEAQMQGADLGRAQMQGADLGRAQMQSADCRSPYLSAVLLHSADHTCAKGVPDQTQLLLAVGNARTRLPPDRFIWSCLRRDSDDPEQPVVQNIDAIEAAIDLHPEQGGIVRISRDRFRKLLFCDDGAHSFKLTYDPFEDRHFDEYGTLR